MVTEDNRKLYTRNMLYDMILYISILHFYVVFIGDSPPRQSYRHVKAKDVLESFKWRELLKDIKDMLTIIRLKIMERDYKLIDSACNLSIKAALNQGNPDEATTAFIEYFEKNHDGDALLRFCEFLRDEAEEAGEAVRLKDLADKIERAVKAKGPSGIIGKLCLLDSQHCPIMAVRRKYIHTHQSKHVFT